MTRWLFAVAVVAGCAGDEEGGGGGGGGGGGSPGDTTPPDDTTEPVDPGPDADGDGFHTDTDCDDADPDVYPGAPDLCGDGRVTDCDRVSDDGLVNLDGVGYGDLQRALDAAGPGAEIELCPGTYVGAFVAPVAVHLVALEDAETTIVSGSGGSALSVPGGTTLTGLTVRDGDGAKGGGVRLTSAGELVLEGCRIEDNHANEGGGLYVAEGGAAILVDTTVSGNDANEGGGVSIAAGGTLDLTLGGEVSANRATGAGGGVRVHDGTVLGGVVASNAIDAYSYPYFYYGLPVFGDDAWSGSGVAASGVSRIEAVDVHDNSGIYGGGVSITGGATTLADTAVHENWVYQLGGGLAVWGGEAVLTGSSEVWGNTGGEAAGGAIVAFGSLAGGVVRDNYGDEYGGGVVAVQSAVQDVQISGNLSYGVGGGLFALGEVTVDRVDLEGNSADAGGGLGTDPDAGHFFYDYTPTVVRVTDSSVVGNDAVDGGGIGSGWGLELVDTSVTDNTAAAGGGLYVFEDHAVIAGGAFARNVADAGGGVFLAGGALTVDGADFGSGADDNDPDDIVASESYGGLGAGTSVSCDPGGCAP